MSEPRPQQGFEALHPAIRHHIVNTFQWRALRPVQEHAIGPILDGANIVLLAPTAGGKTEAAFFPVFSRMLSKGWSGLTVLYVSPIRALLNNQRARLEHLATLVGRRVGTWHGDIAQSVKKRLRADPPDVVLTTPESLEGMLISARGGRASLFGDLRVVVVDEVHAFAGDDRGWHLLGVLDRVSRYAGRDLQRIGLSATVGNPEEIAAWLGSGSSRAHVTIDRGTDPGPEPDVTVDWVGGLDNAALVLAKLHRGEKRLVFCDSRLQAEMLSRLLRRLDVTTHLTHSSLSADQRRQTERAFAEGGPGVIVATSALELGIDIGDLDRVIQIDAPYSVASFLQRMGRTGRRSGTVRNCLFLCVSEDGLLRAAALIDMWKRGVVEPAKAPGDAFHILAQQLLAATLERPGLSVRQAVDSVETLRTSMGAKRDDVERLLDHLVASDVVYSDGWRLGMGPAGEASYGARHFLELVSVFTTPPLFTVLWARRELGTVHQSTFDSPDDKPRVILLGGRSWLVKSLDWTRRVAQVEPWEGPGRSRWLSAGNGVSHWLAEGHRRVVMGLGRGREHWSKRCEARLEEVVEGYSFLEDDIVPVVQDAEICDLWSFGGTRVNALLAKWLVALDVPVTSWNAFKVSFRMTGRVSAERLEELRTELAKLRKLPAIDSADPMLRALKFVELLPAGLLELTAWARWYEPEGVTAVCDRGWPLMSA